MRKVLTIGMLVGLISAVSALSASATTTNNNVGRSSITASNVAGLKPVWRFALPSGGATGQFATKPIVVGGIIYFQDLDSNVYALRKSDGSLMWEYKFNNATIGPNGVVYKYGDLFGVTDTSAFAIDADTGNLLWISPLADSPAVGMDITPQVYNHKVLVSTVPIGSGGGDQYLAGATGVIYSLNARTGRTIWHFNTVPGSVGGGAWYQPAVDSQGRVFVGTGNPGLWPNTPANPNGALRPGNDLYTDSIVALNGNTGKLIWYHQVIPHDIRDHDLETVVLSGTGSDEKVIASGKMGTVYAWRASDGQRSWTRNVGDHLNDRGDFPATLETTCPGEYGGVISPLALAGRTVFAPWLDLCAMGSATGEKQPGFATATGGITAINTKTGKVRWIHNLPSAATGSAEVTNGIVFTTDFTGGIYALSAKSGRLLWSGQATTNINGQLAVSGDLLLVGAGTGGGARTLTAYSI